jgi:hypothetical protein
MKSFNNIRELWEFCLFCPICQKHSRTMDISAGPDHIWDVTSFHLWNDTLIVLGTYKYKYNRYFIDLKINCLDNTFDTVVSYENPFPLKLEVINSLPDMELFLDIQGSCSICYCSTVSSESIDFDLKEKKNGSIQLEREKFYLDREKDKYFVTFWHGDNTMRVAKWNSQTSEEDKEIELPMATLDLTNQAKVIDKLKTYILFS